MKSLNTLTVQCACSMTEHTHCTVRMLYDTLTVQCACSRTVFIFTSKSSLLLHLMKRVCKDLPYISYALMEHSQWSQHSLGLLI